MSIRIKKPESLFKAGGREVNEDFIFPFQADASTDDRIFIVADGEGGPQAGDIGAKLATLTMAKYFQHPGPEGAVDEEFLAKALRITEAALTAHKDGHPEARSLAVSMSLLHLGEEFVTLAWIGTCRIYYFNANTSSLLNPDLQLKKDVETGNHLITGSENPQKFHMFTIPVSELNPEDSFLLISDGVREQLNDRNLEIVLKTRNLSDSENSPAQILKEMDGLIQSFSKDNYAAYLVQLDRDAENVASNKSTPVATKSNKAPAVTAPAKEEEKSKGTPMLEGLNSNLMRTLGIAGLVFFVVALLGWGIWSYFSSSFDRHYNNGISSMEQRNYPDARNYFTKALRATDDPVNQQKATNKLDELERLERSLISPTGNAELTSAEYFLKNGNFESGIPLLEGMLAELEKTGDKNDARSVRLLLAEAYLGQANTLYESAEPVDKCKVSYPVFQKGLIILDKPEITSTKIDLVEKSRKRATQCGIASGQLPTSVNDGIASRVTPKSVNTRSDDGANKAPGARLTDPVARAEQKKWLASGKRTYVKAKEQKSENLYRQAAENLENAGAALDGSGAYLLAYMYHMGLGVERNEAKALQYAQKSAYKAWPSGQYYYGHLLLLRKYPRDTITAVQSLRKAADQNFYDAIVKLNELGVRY